MSPALAMRLPCRKDECWKLPESLMPTYRRERVSETKIHVFFLTVLRSSRLVIVAAERWESFLAPLALSNSRVEYFAARSASAVDSAEESVSDPWAAASPSPGCASGRKV